jgi:hypothetical protein
MAAQAAVPNDLLCKACNVQCNTERAYQNHLRSNRHRGAFGLPPHGYPCPGCRKLYSRLSEVQRHLETGKCSAPRSHVISEVAMKHRLSSASADVACKRRRSRSPDRATNDASPQVLDTNPYMAGVWFNNDLPASDECNQHANGVPSVATVQASSTSGLQLEGIIEVTTCDTGPQTAQTLEPKFSQNATGSLDSEMFCWNDKSRTVVTEAKSQSIALETIAEDIDHDVIDSMRAITVTDSIPACVQSGTGTRATSFRTRLPSSSIRNSYRSSAKTDSLGSLFGHPAAGVRTPDFMRSSARSSERSLLPDCRSSGFSVEMPAPLGELVDDELRWARNGGKRPHYGEVNRDTGRQLMRNATHGNHIKVYESLMSTDAWFDIISLCSGCYYVSWAVQEAISHGHVKVLDAILEAFASISSRNRLQVKLWFLDDYDHLQWDEKVWRGCDRFLRVFVGTMSCLCPSSLRPDTVCERVALGQHCSADGSDEVKSECEWGDKLRQPSWPSLSEFARLTTSKEKQEFFKSLGLAAVFVRPNEQEKTQAHQIRTKELTACLEHPKSCSKPTISATTLPVQEIQSHSVYPDSTQSRGRRRDHPAQTLSIADGPTAKDFGLCDTSISAIDNDDEVFLDAVRTYSFKWREEEKRNSMMFFYD